MPENSIVRAPYNFVPFSGNVLEYKGDLPAHDVIDPSLKTGEIRVTMTTETPVFVSDGDKEDPHFFKGADGKFMLPGSTIRGMTRENMQILGFGLIRPGEDLENYQIFFREMAAARGSTGNNLKQYYHTALDVQTKKTETGKTYSIPKRVCAGYLRKTGADYQIIPTSEPYLRISRKRPDLLQFGDDPARMVPIAYLSTGGKITHLVPQNQVEPDMKYGTLLFTGKPVGNKPNHLYVFPEAAADATPVPVSKEDILSYKMDWEGRRNVLGEKADFWKLPEDGQEKPVFYLSHEGHLYFGMTLFLRIGYKHALSDGLPQHHRDLLNGEEFPMDYPHAILGFTTEQTSYRSRVSFGDFEAQGSPQEMEPFQVILGQPKPSYYPGYTIKGENYTEDDFRLRGYKQYWLKDAHAVQPDKLNVASTLCPLPVGTRFCGVIRFRNLREEELGLLIWALRLEDGCFQSVGMGKPYGYGRMKLKIDQIREINPAAMYTLETWNDGSLDTTAQEKKYIKTYDSFAAKNLYIYIKKPKKDPSICSLPEIKDFFFMHRTIRSGKEVSYMALSEYTNVRTPLPDVASVREAADCAEGINGTAK